MAAYHQAQETARRIEAWTKARGPTTVHIYGGCALNWLAKAPEERAAGQLRGYLPVFAEAANETGAALARMKSHEADALQDWYLRPGAMAEHADRAGISEQTFRRRLKRAHFAFWQAVADNRADAARVAEQYRNQFAADRGTTATELFGRASGKPAK